MIDHLDHLVLTTASEAECIRFYTAVLGMQLESFAGGTPPVERKALKFGNQKINLHVKGREFEPKAKVPMPGALDLCFIAAVPLESVIATSRSEPGADRRRTGHAHRCDKQDPVSLRTRPGP